MARKMVRVTLAAMKSNLALLKIQVDEECYQETDRGVLLKLEGEGFADEDLGKHLFPWPRVLDVHWFESEE